MPVSTEIVIGFVMPVNATNSILAAGQTATTVSEHFVHALRDHGYVVTAMLGMYWLLSSAMNESAESVFFSSQKLAFLVMFFGSTSVIWTPNMGVPMESPR